MLSQSITLTKQNDEWLKSQIAEQQNSSKSEAVNYLIKKERERQGYRDYVQMEINRGVGSGLAEKQTKVEMLAEFQERLKIG